MIWKKKSLKEPWYHQIIASGINILLSGMDGFKIYNYKSNIRFSKHKGWGICANYSDGTLTICRYGKTKQEAEDKVKKRVSEYYGKSKIYI